jgi:DNA-binding transcriptional regulator GbsR (MarR family)
MVKKKAPKPLTPKQFKAKIETQLWKINQAVEAAHAEVFEMANLAEVQMETLDNDPDALTRDNKKFYNFVADVEDWSNGIQEMLEGIDSTSVRTKIKKFAA